ncbi:acyl-CoA thioesterase-1 [Azospirillum agricola]|uniref:arylesterase n=1 Tax=Azospirillum agricola TaxID=1720247 RepID=UPI001F3890C4|nr:arylesterase [Azospirillum agricola]MBP2229849.1 acyl-CoA thioesterase-1 [Azospirillum agricola]
MLLAAGVSMTILPATSPASAAAAPVKLLALGDSLTAGYGLPEPQGFASQLQKALTAKGYSVTVVNAGVSGDTTAGGLARLDWALADKPDAALVELGANDMLRGLDPAAAKANLDAILTRLNERRIPTLLAGMLASPSLGRPYTERFNALYPELAKTHGVPLYPFFLDGVATERALIQADGLHPNAQGVAVIVERILPDVTRLLDSLPKTGG